MRANTFRRLINLWPPFLCNAIRVVALSEDWCHAHVVLRLRPWNRNAMHTQFGGNLFTMTDPVWAVLLMHRLGPDYHVWDKAAHIDFVAPGRTTVHARFDLPPAQLEQIRADAAGGNKVLSWFETRLTTAEGELVAVVRKQLYVRLKREARSA